jgi:L-2-hydroxyglutarate oxidase
VPFRGEYYRLREEARGLCRTLIYPVPDPRFPFLGVHLTRRVDGQVDCGPNAVLALAREGYTFGTVNLRDLFETLAYPGFLRMGLKFWRMGLSETWRSLSKAAFVRAIRRLTPELDGKTLEVAPAGVRAQALGHDGVLVDDFILQDGPRMVHVVNAPSPAATASLQIANVVVGRVVERMRA